MTPALATRSGLSLTPDVESAVESDVESAVESVLAHDLEVWMRVWGVEPAALRRLVEGAVSGVPVDTSISAEARSDLARTIERAGRALLAR